MTKSGDEEVIQVKSNSGNNNAVFDTDKLKDRSKNKKKSNIPSSVMLSLGAILIFISMINQGGLAGLFTDEIAKEKEWAPETRYPLDAATGIFGALGKWALIFFVSMFGYKIMGTKDYWRSYLSAEEWKEYIKYAWFALAPSAVFGYLGDVSMNQMASLVRGIKTKSPIPEKIAEYFENPWAQRVFIVVPVLTNLKAMPFINKGGVDSILDAMDFLFQNPNFRSKREELQKTGDRVRMKYREYINDRDFVEAFKILNTLGIDENTNFDEILKNKKDKQALRLKMLELFSKDQDRFEIKKISQTLEKFLKFLNYVKTPLALCALINVIIGFTNFYSLGMNTGNIVASWLIEFFKFMHVENELFFNIVNNALGYSFAVNTVVSMTFLGFLPYHFIRESIKEWNGIQTPVRIIDSKIARGILTGIILIGGIIGAFPNALQSYLLARQSLFFVIHALTSPSLVEWSGFWGLTEAIVEYVKRKDPQLDLAFDVDEFLRKVTDLSGVSYDELNELQKLMPEKIPDDDMGRSQPMSASKNETSPLMAEAPNTFFSEQKRYRPIVNHVRNAANKLAEKLPCCKKKSFLVLNPS